MAEQVIKQIKTNDGALHDIDASYLNGKTYNDIHNEIIDIAQGGIETYVIPKSKSTASGYYTIVSSTETTVSVNKTYLDNLTSGQANGGYKLGDVILLEEISDGTKVFDRWVSKVSDNDIYLSILETQVATHHHTINIGSTSGKALTGIEASSQTAALTVVGDAVDVLTSAAGTFVTSVTHKDDGGYDLEISTGSSTDGSKSHYHTTVAHSHSFKPTSIVSQTVGAYTSLTSETRTLHSHTVVSVAGKSIDDSAFNIATGASKSGTFLVNLKDSANQDTGTNTKGLATGNSGVLSTSAQTSSDTIGSVVNTLAGGSHEHTVTTTTNTSVVTEATVAASVVTSVSHKFTKSTVAGNVIVSVGKIGVSAVTSAVLTGTTTFFNSATVDSSGILSFGTDSVGISAPRTTVSAVGTITSSIQSACSLTINAPRSSQSITSGTVTATGTAAQAGSHSHGFSHTHSIPTHNHSIEGHTHTYVKTIASQTGSAITTLSLKSYTPHTHNNVGVASIADDESGAITIVTGGSQTNVVQNLKNSSFNTEDSSPNTNSTYLKISGEITFPSLEYVSGSVTTSSKSITPAATGSEKALKSITFTSSNFVKTVTSGSKIKTTENIGGK